VTNTLTTKQAEHLAKSLEHLAAKVRERTPRTREISVEIDGPEEGAPLDAPGVLRFAAVTIRW